MWEVQTGELVAAWSGFEGPVTHAQFSPDGRLLLTGDGTGRAQVWDASTGQAVTPPLRHGPGLTLAAFGPDGKQVVTVTRGGVVRFWGLPRAPKQGDATSPDGGKLEAGPRVVDGRRRLLKLAGGVTLSMNQMTVGALHAPRSEDQVVEQAVFSPDGGRVVVCDDDSTARIWDTATGNPLTPPLRHRSAVFYAAFSRDGHRLITASADRTARVWDAYTGEMLAPPLKHARPIERVFFQAGGERACVVQRGGVLSTWDLTPDMRPVDELVALAQVLACTRINEKEERRPLEADRLRSTWERMQAAR